MNLIKISLLWCNLKIKLLNSLVIYNVLVDELFLSLIIIDKIKFNLLLIKMNLTNFVKKLY